MKRRFLIITSLFGLLWCSPVTAADYNKGWVAFQKGDYATALAEWKPLAEQGVVVAQYNLGLMYQHGNGVPLDGKQAVKWYSLAAEKGFGGAQYKLGWMYYRGNGVPLDYMKAYMWFSIAASLGYKYAIKGRETAVKEMTPTQITEAQRLARECTKKKYKSC
jgi:uncharacterized protein